MPIQVEPRIAKDAAVPGGIFLARYNGGMNQSLAKRALLRGASAGALIFFSGGTVILSYLYARIGQPWFSGFVNAASDSLSLAVIGVIAGSLLGLLGQWLRGG